MQSEIKVGQRFTFNILSDDPAPERQAVVTRVLSNREEGFGPEVDFFFSYWVEARRQGCERMRKGVPALR